jgi:hypothetical protein
MTFWIESGGSSAVTAAHSPAVLTSKRTGGSSASMIWLSMDVAVRWVMRRIRPGTMALTICRTNHVSSRIAATTSSFVTISAASWPRLSSKKSESIVGPPFMER